MTQVDVANELPDLEFSELQYNDDGSLDLNSESPFPLVRPISYRRIEDRHVWIAVEVGSAVVLTEREHELFRKLARGEPPKAIADHLELVDHISREESWEIITALLSTLIDRGFMKGIAGATEARIPAFAGQSC